MMNKKRHRRGSGLIASMGAIAIVFVVAYLFIFPVIQTQSCTQNSVVIGPAELLAAQIREYPTINGTDCSSLLELVSNGNQIVYSMDNVLGTSFDQQNISNVCNYGIQYAPLLGAYNDLILSARSVDPNNPTSVTAFYEKIFLFASDYFIVNDAIDKISYNVAFKTVGELNDNLMLGKLAGLCGDSCYSTVLSQIHWFIRDNFSNILTDDLSSVGSKLDPNSCAS